MSKRKELADSVRHTYDDLNEGDLEKEILTLRNVPTVVAAKYLDVDTQFVRLALQQQRCPYGHAVVNPGGRWSYHISPGLLVAYKKGTLALAMAAGEG